MVVACPFWLIAVEWALCRQKKQSIPAAEYIKPTLENMIIEVEQLIELSSIICHSSAIDLQLLQSVCVCVCVWVGGCVGVCVCV